MVLFKKPFLESSPDAATKFESLNNAIQLAPPAGKMASYKTFLIVQSNIINPRGVAIPINSFLWSKAV